MKRSALLLLCLALPGAGARAQDFAGPAPPLGDRAPLAFLEHGLPPAERTWGAAALAIRWHGLPELVTRSVGLGAGWRSTRFALGMSQTGVAELGWSALGIGLGAASRRMGAGLRACARAALSAPAALPASGRAGLEVGVGGWTAPSERFRLWASAPQAFMHGAPPPLERWLEIGASARIGEGRLWLARALVPFGARGASTEHAAGMAMTLGAGTLWAELRDHPVRGRVGIEARAGIMGVAAAVESHPVLDETVRLRLLLGGSDP